jgi:HEAT repeat protein
LITFFCPQCWKEIKGDYKICPRCGAVITEHEKKGFEEKLINALNHPERETVQRAVWILGRLKSIESVKPLLSLFEHTDDPYIKAEILDTLDQIETPQAVGFILRSFDSEISIVRRAARALMERKFCK